MTKPKVYLLDDDEEFLDALSLLLNTSGWETIAFSDPEAFLNHYPPKETAIVLLDVRMPTISGIDVFETMQKKGSSPPIIFLTGHGSLDMAVHVLTHGASNFVQKPILPERLFSALEKAQEEIETSQENKGQYFRDNWKLLTEKEKKVVYKLLEGLSNQDIAELYGISPRTVEAHKFRAMQKLGVHRLSDLLRFALPLKDL